MLKRYLVIPGLLASFGVGFAVHSLTQSTNIKQTTMKRVTGIGGVFFKCKDPEKMKEWYKTHLGFEVTPYGVKFEWKDPENPSKTGSTVWSPFPETSKYFAPSEKDFMFNYRVDNLEGLVEELKKEGVVILDKMETYEYGKFIHIMDPEGNKIELWEPLGE